ncbi:MAG TPA: hypothetical protein VMW50_10285 [Dehalococcoidia bacterium]|nr:hypothetical protein [Dehalococcoidia bacterium]
MGERKRTTKTTTGISELLLARKKEIEVLFRAHETKKSELFNKIKELENQLAQLGAEGLRLSGEYRLILQVEEENGKQQDTGQQPPLEN